MTVSTDELLADPSRTRAPAVARAAAVLRALARERSGLGVTEIARRVDLIASTCFHVLKALVAEGFVTFDPEKKTYRVGVGLLTLARDAISNSEFPKIVQPSLDDLAQKLRVSALATTVDGGRDQMVVVALSRSDSMVSLHINVGCRCPAFISATGRCIAAASGLSKEELRVRFKQLQWERPPKFEDWYSEVQRTKSEGTGLDRGTFIRGVTVVATLIPAGLDGAKRAIAVIGFEHHMTEKMIIQAREGLLGAAQVVAAQIQ
jgi:DNA-binding IclR family transcriptional regulator